MTFEEEAAELHRLEAVAKSLGMTERAFELIALDVNRRGKAEGTPFEEQLAEIRRRITARGRRTHGPS
jgi:hypothetical protein